SVNAEVTRQAEADRKLITLACHAEDGLADRVLTGIKNVTIDDMRGSIGTTLVPDTRVAFDLDELTLATGAGEVLGADPLERRTPTEVAALIRGSQGRFDLR